MRQAAEQYRVSARRVSTRSWHTAQSSGRVGGVSRELSLHGPPRLVGLDPPHRLRSFDPANGAPRSGASPAQRLVLARTAMPMVAGSTLERVRWLKRPAERERGSLDGLGAMVVGDHAWCSGSTLNYVMGHSASISRPFGLLVLVLLAYGDSSLRKSSELRM
jgi:hypothetical protein